MAARFLDANIFLRYFTRDDPEKAERCRELLQRVRTGEEEVTTSESVIAEVVYVLSSARLYGLDPERIRALLFPVLTLKGMQLRERRLYLQALDLYVEHHLDFEDALTVAHVQRRGIPAIVSYDRDFDQVKGIRREEP